MPVDVCWFGSVAMSSVNMLSLGQNLRPSRHVMTHFDGASNREPNYSVSMCLFLLSYLSIFISFQCHYDYVNKSTCVSNLLVLCDI